jgi:DNA replicative helicase MCM subunit Mcm2 (Cdc46/Mcm family)
MRGWGTVQRVLRELYDEENGVPREEIVREAVREGVPRDDAEDAVDELKRRGEIYNSDPKNNLLKPTPTR